MSEFINIIDKMVDTVLVGGLTIGYGGLPLNQAYIAKPYHKKWNKCVSKLFNQNKP